MLELRTYSLANEAARRRYTEDFWPRHVRSLAKYGITVHGVWTDTATDGHRVLALIGYRTGEDPHRLADAYRDSTDFVADHADFDVALITSVHTVTLEPVAGT
ncbi:NIPSNAP domain-containing protein [Mycolicibacterium cosmeticum]|uniref:NIPSNAP domain-containing protein n=1 Tax=Mycolicibacterium cosmeticum TaxID=258533 RepID=UPI003204C6B0